MNKVFIKSSKLNSFRRVQLAVDPAKSHNDLNFCRQSKHPSDRPSLERKIARLDFKLFQLPIRSCSSPTCTITSSSAKPQNTLLWTFGPSLIQGWNPRLVQVSPSPGAHIIDAKPGISLEAAIQARSLPVDNVDLVLIRKLPTESLPASAAKHQMLLSFNPFKRARPN